MMIVNGNHQTEGHLRMRKSIIACPLFGVKFESNIGTHELCCRGLWKRNILCVLKYLQLSNSISQICLSMGNFRKSIGQYKRSDFLNRGIIYKEKHNKRTVLSLQRLTPDKSKQLNYWQAMPVRLFSNKVNFFKIIRKTNKLNDFPSTCDCT